MAIVSPLANLPRPDFFINSVSICGYPSRYSSKSHSTVSTPSSRVPLELRQLLAAPPWLHFSTPAQREGLPLTAQTASRMQALTVSAMQLKVHRLVHPLLKAWRTAALLEGSIVSILTLFNMKHAQRAPQNLNQNTPTLPPSTWIPKPVSTVNLKAKRDRKANIPPA